VKIAWFILAVIALVAAIWLGYRATAKDDSRPPYGATMVLT